MAIAKELTPELVTTLIDDAVTKAFQIMVGCSANKGKTRPHAPTDSFYPVTAVIGLAGDVAGSVCVSMPRQAAADLVRRILDISVDSDSPLVRDGVGELANIIVGSAKNKLEEYSLRLGLPTMVLGDDVTIMFPSQSVPKSITYESEIGILKLVVGLQRR